MNKNSRGEAQSSKRMSLLSISLKVQVLLQKNQTPVILTAIPILKLPKQEPMTKQKKVNSTLSLKWMPLALNNSKLIRASKQQSNNISKHVLASQKSIVGLSKINKPERKAFTRLNLQVTT